MIKVDILFSNHFITLHLLSFLVSTFMYISRPDRPTHGISYLQNYFRIDKYPKPCSFLFSKKKRKLLVLEDLYFFDMGILVNGNTIHIPPFSFIRDF